MARALRRSRSPDPSRPPLPAALRRRLVVSSAAVVALLALVVFSLVAASGYARAVSSATSSASASAMPAVDSPGFVSLPHRAPVAFTLPELVRPWVKVSLASLEGKPLLLNFWSSSCTVCAEEAPAIAEADRRLGAVVTFVGIDTDEPSRGAGLAFARKYKMDYRLLYDGSAAVASRYTAGLPVTFFVSAEGKLVGENLGASSVTTLEQQAHKLFGVPAS